jgi:hypothetical protein
MDQQALCAPMNGDNRGLFDKSTGPDTDITSEQHMGSAQIDNRDIDECADSTTQSEHPSQPNKPEKSLAITRDQYIRRCCVLTDQPKIMSESDVRSCSVFFPGLSQKPRFAVVMPAYKENVSSCGRFELRGHSQERQDVAPSKADWMPRVHGQKRRRLRRPRLTRQRRSAV